MIGRRKFGFALAASLVRAAAETKSPYPPSPFIRSVHFDWATHKRDAQGSDNWQLTWPDDDHLYGAWGDGGGFGGTNSDGRVSLGVARIEGAWDNYKESMCGAAKTTSSRPMSTARAGA
ncbi:MAG TPA: hypothetical protein VEX68_07240 [Bryobacteraceae bacterium]|nr:hypothetical protein [Bryobacteraceae bacterium]